MATLTNNSLDNCTSIPDFIPAGTRMVFSSSTAPSSWTKTTDHSNKALRLVTGPVSPGGSTVFSTVFPDQFDKPVAGSINSVDSADTFQGATVPVQATTGSFDAFPTWIIQPVTIDEQETAIHNHSYNRRAPGTNTAGQTGPTQCIKDNIEPISFGGSGAGGSHAHAWPTPAQASKPHNHPLSAQPHSHGVSPQGPHSHGFTTTAQNFKIKYVDVIVCSKN